MPAHIRVSGSWKKINKMYVRVGGVWKEIKKAHVRVGGSWKQFHSGATEITISASATTPTTLFTLAGSPSSAGEFIFTINSGVTLSSNTTATAAVVVGAFPSGSIVRIINNGSIRGMGGAGGSTTNTQVTNVGNPGGDAISLSSGYTVEIDNTNGNIWGGGGGGGGGYANGSDCSGAYIGGGGGGGASGSTNSAGGSVTGGSGATAGSAGTSSGPGNGGNGLQGTFNKGGNGGTWGAAGDNGAGPAVGSSPNARPGGAGGRAVRLNGNSVTWLGGNNGSQVRGAVS